MNLEEIKVRLEKENYFVKNGQDYILAGNEGLADNLLGIRTIIDAFFVKIESNLLKVEYLQGQVPFEKAFSNLEDLVKYVTVKFPPNRFR